MPARPRILGGVIGTCVALLVLSFPGQAPRSIGAMVNESGGAIRELVIHYVAGDQIALPVYQQFLPLLPADVTVHVLCPDRVSFDELVARIPSHACPLQPIATNHPLTVWSRDRWVAMFNHDTNVTTLLASRDEDAADIWPQRAGDALTPFDLAEHFPGHVMARRLGLFFDGGDLLADGEHVFGTRALLERNLHRTVDTQEQLFAAFRMALGTDLTLLENPPDHHAGMFMMSVGEKTLIVGDPSLGRSIYSSDFPQLPDGPDFSEQTQEQFDSVARQLEKLGYRVVRIPTLLSPDTKTYLTYVNVITDRRNGEKIVYMPVYRGAEAMNESAAEIWRGLGYRVHPIDCTSTFQHFGNLHCLVNVLRRDGADVQ